MDKLMAETEKAVGYACFGYWYFFAEEGADKLIEENVSSNTRILNRSH